MSNQKPSFRFKIDNFSEKEAVITSKTFITGGCEWLLNVYPKGDKRVNDHLCLFLKVGNRKSLGTGWKRNAKFYFVVLDQSEKELCRSFVAEPTLFSVEKPSHGFRDILPLSKFQEKGFLENDKVIIEVYIEILEAVDGEGGAISKSVSVNMNGFQVLLSKAKSVRKLFAEHPDIAENFKPKNQAVKAAYMTVLLRLIKKLRKQSLSETQLEKASGVLSELMDVGFKLDWLKLKLEKLSLEKKKTDADVSLVKQLGERVTVLEQMELEVKLVSLKSKLEELSLERNKASAVWSRVDQLEERFENFDLMELGLELDTLKTKLDEVSLKRKESDNANESRSQNLEERVENIELMELSFALECVHTKFNEISMARKNDVSQFQQLEKRVEDLEEMDLESELDGLHTKLEEVSQEREDVEFQLKEVGTELDDLNEKLEKVSVARKKDESRFQKFEERVKDLEVTAQAMRFKLECLNTKLEKDSLERKKAEVADASRFQELEESVKDLKLMVLHLKGELDKKKDKSSADGFLLVNEDV